MRFTSLNIAAALLCTTTGFLLSSCVRPAGPVVRTLGAWPPISANCARNQVDTQAIGGELTRVHADPACVAQTAGCIWVNLQTVDFPNQEPGTMPWGGPSGYIFPVGEQDSIVANTRAMAEAARPSGTELYRLTFEASVVVGPAPVSETHMSAKAYYGACTFGSGTRRFGDEDQPAK